MKNIQNETFRTLKPNIIFLWWKVQIISYHNAFPSTELAPQFQNFR